MLHLTPERAKTLIPVGAAGALSAAFNTPVAAVIFALEEIIGDMNAGAAGSTVVASVASVIVERSILGNAPLFHVPRITSCTRPSSLAYAALGIVGGLVSLVFCKSLLACARFPATAEVDALVSTGDRRTDHRPDPPGRRRQSWVSATSTSTRP